MEKEIDEFTDRLLPENKFCVDCKHYFFSGVVNGKPTEASAHVCIRSRATLDPVTGKPIKVDLSCETERYTSKLLPYGTLSEALIGHRRCGREGRYWEKK